MTNSIMAQEARQAATVIADQLKHNKPVCDALAETLRILQPSMIMMVARGSSDHAGVFADFLGGLRYFATARQDHGRVWGSYRS